MGTPILLSPSSGIQKIILRPPNCVYARGRTHCIISLPTLTPSCCTHVWRHPSCLTHTCTQKRPGRCVWKPQETSWQTEGRSYVHTEHWLTSAMHRHVRIRGEAKGSKCVTQKRTNEKKMSRIRDVRFRNPCLENVLLKNARGSSMRLKNV